MLQPDPAWPGFCRAIGKPELENDPLFNTLDARSQNRQALIHIIEEVLVTRTMAEWETLFKQYNCIYGRVQTPVEVTTDPQALANNFFADVDYAGLGSIKLLTSPLIFRDYPATIRTPAPELGQHTEEILLELGYTWDDIGRLKEQGVIL
jgi:crotonobetainyl-CoA:carnitine CoA-transferase CaiB-like acyl-CoA transferase